MVLPCFLNRSRTLLRDFKESLLSLHPVSGKQQHSARVYGLRTLLNANPATGARLNPASGSRIPRSAAQDIKHANHNFLRISPSCRRIGKDRTDLSANTASRAVLQDITDLSVDKFLKSACAHEKSFDQTQLWAGPIGAILYHILPFGD